MAIKTPERWLLHAGDAYYHERRMGETGGCTPGFIAFEWFAHIDHGRAMKQMRALWQVVNRHKGEVETCCTHDPSEFERLQKKQGN